MLPSTHALFCGRCGCRGSTLAKSCAWRREAGRSLGRCKSGECRNPAAGRHKHRGLQGRQAHRHSSKPLSPKDSSDSRPHDNTGLLLAAAPPPQPPRPLTPAVLAAASADDRHLPPPLNQQTGGPRPVRTLGT
ncbi:hypothetical protein P7K49_031980 [Saguinus oedipus]|uniref:Uncharacterized protein n=1 Tax=Saguinus oedipus TaxID=9490 RepID=A0ABQ9U0Y4_SAGOE|nr:hypothetical protein P7K49_031980 [Saguinus oedipus]